MAEIITQLLINGISLGCAYALITLGFVLVINAIGAVNFAQGDLVMAGGFLAVILAEFIVSDSSNLKSGLGLIVLPLVLVSMAILGVLFSIITYTPLRKRPPVAVFISTIAAGLVIQHGINTSFGPEPQIGPALINSGSITVGSVTIATQQIAIIVTTSFLIFLVSFLMKQTQLGRKLRAAAQNPEMAESIGINGPQCIAITFSIAIALAGAAGVLLSNQFFVTTNDGGLFMLKAYIAVTIGGWGRLDGAVIAALAIGLFEVIIATLVSYVMAEALLYTVLLLVLLFRPSGLMPEAIQRRT
jgi:branched-chain amino acid transport system permease protein